MTMGLGRSAGLSGGMKQMEGQRVEKKGHGSGSKKPWIIVGCVAGAVLVAYLGLCAWVGSTDTIFPNVSVAGIDVSGMTKEQAQTFLEETMSAQGDQAVVNVTYGDWTGTVTAAELDTISWSGSAANARNVGREHFLTQGAAYLAHRLNASSNAVFLWTGNEPKALLELCRQAERLVGDTTEAAYEVEDDRLAMTKGRTGVSVDGAALWNSIRDAFEGTDGALAEKFGQGKEGTVAREIQLPVTEMPPQEPDFAAIHAQLHTEPVSAQMDPKTYEIADHVVGVDFDVEELKAAYAAAAEGERFTVPLELTQPKDTRESLESKLFADLLGEGTTRVSGSSNRKHNVKLSAQACDGIILLPGEEFSYNNTTGSRSAAKGYLPAPVYVGGASTDEVGGGICQTSSTIYYAVLHTSLEVVERKCHMYNTGYVAPGMDATVYYGNTDFRFKNNTEYPVKIVTSSYDSNGSRYLNVKIYGTNPEGIYAVPTSSTFDRVAPGTKYQPDPTVPQGTLVLDRKQNAYTGISAHTYRSIYNKDGELIEKQDMGSSKYRHRDHLYHYNPLDGDPATWENGQPPQPVDPGTTAPVDPGTTTPVDPGADPGTADPVGPGPDPVEGPGATQPEGPAPGADPVDQGAEEQSGQSEAA